jgi:hypothetical protein
MQDELYVALDHWDGGAWTYTIVPGMTAFDRTGGLWGSGSNDVWAVGWGTAPGILHWNGTMWSSTVASDNTKPLHGVWGSATNDVWAVGDEGTILQWRGATWSGISSPTTYALRGISGSPSSNDVWAVGVSGTIVHWSR